MISSKVKKFIFNRLYEDLSNVEIIPYKDSIWFIDRENVCWYFEYEKSGILFWRYKFFNDFFSFFSLKPCEFEWIISEWVEEVLNCRISSHYRTHHVDDSRVEEALNCKVSSPRIVHGILTQWVEDVLNYKVTYPCETDKENGICVEKVLNYKVNETSFILSSTQSTVSEVLTYSVTKTVVHDFRTIELIKEGLEYKVCRPTSLEFERVIPMERVLNSKNIS